MRLPALLFMLIPLFAYPQSTQWSASEIKLKLKKLNFLGSVLYVAAHPDDENTRVIAYLANDRLAATAYLSMTRGDGGQNLIGPEIRDLLGLIRTQELLTARKIDGGQQFFTRAIDFGFSKNVTETFEIWNKEEVLSDVVRVIRQYQPDVLLNRFPADERAAGHGQHTASSVLAQEAFDVASKADRYPDQVKRWGVWQPKRLFTNTGRWWNQTIDENTPGIVTLNVGSYNTLLGKSYAEIAAESRTQHKSQGFGSPGRRGDALDFFEPVKGEGASSDIFDNVNVTWSRVKGGDKVQPLVDKAIHDFDVEKPYLSVPLLLQIRKAITQVERGVWRERKLNEVNSLLQASIGLFAEVTADQYNVAPGEKVKLNFEIVNRAKSPITLVGIQSQVLSFDSVANTDLGPNKLITFRSLKTLSREARYSSPYWLKEEHTQGLFTVGDPDLIGQPENEPAVVISMVFEVEGEELRIPCPLIYKWTDPVKGELERPFVIVPPVSIGLTSTIYIFKDSSPQQVNVMVKSVSNEPVTGMLRLDVPDGWKSSPAQEKFELTKRGLEKTISFTVTAAQGETTSRLKAVATVNGIEFDQSIQTISYDHIPTQALLPKAQARAVKLNLKKEGSRVGYIKGAGDDIPAALRHIGYEVWEMKNDEVTTENLKKVDAVVLGVRALNTNERIRYFMPELLSFVHNGGTMVMQYNTSNDLEIDPDKFSPYPLTLSRDRVTEENSEVRILKPDHPALNFPNKIDAVDFSGWVQERGLYFPGKWDPHFEALLSSNDKGEPPRDGGLLVAKYGEGYYVYTGLSFFRELPEGVGGAYRLFANLVSLGKAPKPQNQKVKASRK